MRKVQAVSGVLTFSYEKWEEAKTFARKMSELLPNEIMHRATRQAVFRVLDVRIEDVEAVTSALDKDLAYDTLARIGKKVTAAAVPPISEAREAYIQRCIDLANR